MIIKFMSYNTQHCLNYVTRKIDYDIIVDTIKNCEADIIGLQEMRNKGEAEDYEAQAKILAERLGFHYYFAEAIRVGGKNPYGNAILSRFAITNAQTIMIPDPEVKGHGAGYETRCILNATFDICGGFSVLVSHFGLNPDEHKNAVKTVVANLPKNRCVLMGDFNMQPDNPILYPLMEKLHDTACEFTSPKLSFPSDVPRVKIDYIFVSNDLAVCSADILPIVSSDHRPYVAEIEI